jgi:hypothetical protein
MPRIGEICELLMLEENLYYSRYEVSILELKSKTTSVVQFLTLDGEETTSVSNDLLRPQPPLSVSDLSFVRKLIDPRYLGSKVDFYIKDGWWPVILLSVEAVSRESEEPTTLEDLSCTVYSHVYETKYLVRAAGLRPVWFWEGNGKWFSEVGTFIHVKEGDDIEVFQVAKGHGYWLPGKVMSLKDKDSLCRLTTGKPVWYNVASVRLLPLPDTPGNFLGNLSRGSQLEVLFKDCWHIGTLLTPIKVSKKRTQTAVCTVRIPDGKCEVFDVRDLRPRWKRDGDDYIVMDKSDYIVQPSSELDPLQPPVSSFERQLEHCDSRG